MLIGNISLEILESNINQRTNTMFHDILSRCRKKLVTREETEEYSVLTCRCCHKEAEFIGRVSISTLPGGWSAMSLDTLGNSTVFQWLLCQECTNRVRVAAGLHD